MITTNVFVHELCRRFASWEMHHKWEITTNVLMHELCRRFASWDEPVPEDEKTE